jgi:hypothetical protein
MMAPLREVPEVFDLMSLSGQLRRVHAERLVSRLLDKAAARVDRPIQWHETPAGYSGELATSGATGAIAVGSGAAFLRTSRGELHGYTRRVTGLSDSICDSISSLLVEARRGLFAKEFGRSVGFLGLLPAIQVNRQQPLHGLQVEYRTPNPVVRVTNPRRAILEPQSWLLQGGGVLRVTVPSTLLASPDRSDPRMPLSSRKVEYIVRGPMLPEGPQVAVQTGFGVSPPGEIKNGRWFPSGREGVKPDKLTAAAVSSHPLVYIGRLTAPSDSNAPPCVDLLLFTVNPDQDGAIDFIGLQSMSAVLSSVLRWEVWSAMLTWAGIDFEIIDNALDPGVSRLSMTTKRPPKPASIGRSPGLVADWTRLATGPSDVLMTLQRLSADLATDTQSHRRRLLDLIASFDALKGSSPDDIESCVKEANSLLLRLGVHLSCPTCGKPSVLLVRRTTTRTGERAGVVAQHTAMDDRTKHSPKSWLDVPRLVDRDTASSATSALSGNLRSPR